MVGNDEKDAMTIRKWARTALGTGLGAVAVAALTVVGPSMPTSSASPGSAALPAPVVDEVTHAGVESETAVFAGGCFWGVQGLFQHVSGVTAAESGYVGGAQQTANYEAVSTGKTGHVESVRITYDPAQVTYGQLLQVFFSAVEDAGQVTGPPPGPQYRSIVFAQDATQQRVAQSYLDQLNEAAVFPGPIVTTVSPKSAFFAAERYHQDFMYLNPTEPYIAGSEMPKLADLKREFPQQYREQPVLLLADGR